MMKQIPLILAVCITVFAAQAQKADLLKGKWQYKDVLEKEKLDSLTLKMAEISKSMQMEFAADGTYIFGQTPMGTWALNAAQDKIVYTLINGKTNEQAIVSLKTNELVLDMGRAKFMFGRPSAAPANPAAATAAAGPAKTINIHETAVAKAGSVPPEEAIIKLVSVVRTGDLYQVMNTAALLGIKSFSLAADAEGKKVRNFNSGSWEECLPYESDITLFNTGVISSKMDVNKFKSGDIQIFINLSPEVHEALYKRLNEGALTLIDQDQASDYYGVGTEESLGLLRVPNGHWGDLTEVYTGGGCAIYHYKGAK